MKFNSYSFLVVIIVLISLVFPSAIHAAPGYVLMTLIVDTTVDDPALTACTAAANDCSLRGAITTANASLGNAIVISIPAGTFYLTVSGAGENNAATGDLDLRNNINLRGAGQNLTTISAVQIVDRVFHVMRDANDDLVLVGIVDVTIEQGNAIAGGGILVQGGNILSLNRSVVRGSNAIDGGGLYSITSSVVLFDSNFVANHSAQKGGGIYVLGGSLSITDSAIVDNEASLQGGGLHNAGGIVTVNNSFFTNNTASDLVDGSGGGISNGPNGNITLTQVTVDHNVALGDGGSYPLPPSLYHCWSNPGGGGIYNEGTLIIESDSLIDQNTANFDYGCGGGIFSNGGQVDVHDSVISANSASIGGGLSGDDAAVILSTVNVLGNLASQGGGGLYNSGSNLDILAGSLIEHNLVNGLQSGASYGGGIWNSDMGELTISDAIVRNNDLINDENGRGGGISSLGGLTLSHVLVQNNNIITTQAFAAGAGVYVETLEAGLAITNDSQILGNYAEGNTWAVAGLYVSHANSNPITISDSWISNNLAEGGSEAATGGIRFFINESPIIVITNSLINNNTAQLAGPGITTGGLRLISTGSPQVAIEDTTIGNNVAASSSESTGGGIRIDADGAGGSLTITRSNIHDNTADFGGGIGLLNTLLWNANELFTLVINDSRIDSNEAIVDGGGIWVNSTGAELIGIINGSTISNNTADAGAGLYTQSIDYSSAPSTGRLAVNNSTLSGNIATNEGGALHIFQDVDGFGNGVLTEAGLNNVTLVNNMGSGTQNALHADRGAITVQNSLVSDTPLAASPTHCTTANVGVISSAGHNLESDTSCGFAQPGDIQNSTSLVDVLLLNGGLTRTHALGGQHDAIDAGKPTGCEADLDGDGITETILALDQRGNTRPLDGDGDSVLICDIGAYEYP